MGKGGDNMEVSIQELLDAQKELISNLQQDNLINKIIIDKQNKQLKDLQQELEKYKSKDANE